MTGDTYLRGIKKDLEGGRPRRCAGTTLLGKFGYVRRRQTAIDAINESLNRLGLKTNPELTTSMPLWTPQIQFAIESAESPPIEHAVPMPDETQEAEAVDEGFSPVTDFAIREVVPDTQTLCGVLKSEPIHSAITRMSLYGYSQLVVIDGHSKLVGLVSFRSITIANQRDKKPRTVGDCLEPDTISVPDSLDLSEALRRMGTNDAIVLLDRSEKVTGIVTTSDLAREFATVFEPFRLLEEIESLLRARIKREFEGDEIEEILDGQVFSANGENVVAGLTLGQLISIVEPENRWSRLALPADRVTMLDELHRARALRNDLMHFRRKLDEAEIEQTKKLRDFLRQVI